MNGGMTWHEPQNSGRLASSIAALAPNRRASPGRTTIPNSNSQCRAGESGIRQKNTSASRKRSATMPMARAIAWGVDAVITEPSGATASLRQGRLLQREHVCDEVVELLIVKLHLGHLRVGHHRLRVAE